MRHRRRDPRAPLPFNRARVAVVRQGRSARGGAMNSLHVPVRVPLCEFVCVLYYSMTMAARSGVARDDDVLHLVTVSCEAGFPFVLWLSLIPRARPAPAHRPTHPRERGGRLARTMNVDEITGELQHAIREALEHARSCHPAAPKDVIAALAVQALGSVLHEDAMASVSPPATPLASLPPAIRSRPIRVYIDGCFDIMHSGHYNALRQAKTLGHVLVAGVHSDAEITRQKGPPVMNDDERLEAVRACKWVDEVVFDTPYTPSLQLLDKLNCDFVVHGDDMPTSADGSNVYDEVMSAGRLRIIKRTDGVSTTDLVGRLLMMTTEHHIASGRLHRATSGEMGAQHKLALTSRVLPSSSFMATTRRISQFSNNRSITPDDRVVYLAGSFDLFHVGHMETLIKAKALGTFLYVGILDDQTVNKMYGSNLPIMNLHERVLNVLSCRAVDEVLLCAPWAVTEALIKSLHVAVVASGGNVDEPCEGDKGRFDVAIAMGIHQPLGRDRHLTTSDVITRIVNNRKQFELKHAKRAPKEAKYMAERDNNIVEV